MRIFQGRVLTGLGQSNDERSGSEGTDRLIPLEELATWAVIIHMRALLQLELIPKCDSACWAVYPLAGFDHGVGHPSRLLCNVKYHNYQKNNVLYDLDY